MAKICELDKILSDNVGLEAENKVLKEQLSMALKTNEDYWNKIECGKLVEVVLCTVCQYKDTITCPGSHQSFGVFPIRYYTTSNLTNCSVGKEKE